MLYLPPADAAGLLLLDQLDAIERAAAARCRTRNGDRVTTPGFVLAHGRPFVLHGRPAGLYRMIPQRCFKNCHTLAARQPERFDYLEGYAACEAVPMPFHHAAVFDREWGRVWCPTLPDHDFPARFVGVMFRPGVAADHWARCRRTPSMWESLLDDGRGGGEAFTEFGSPAGRLLGPAEYPAETVPVLAEASAPRPTYRPTRAGATLANSTEGRP